MQLQPRLFHKLIAIVALPLAFELVLTVCLFGLVSKAEMQAMNEHNAKRAAEDLTDLWQRTTAAAQVVAVVVLKEGQAPDIVGFNKQEAFVAEDLKDIRSLVAGDPATTARIEDLDESITAALRVVDEALQDVQSGSRLSAIARLRHLKNTVPAITRKLEELRTHFNETANDEFYNQRRSRKLIMNSLGIAVVVNIAIVIALVIFIHRNITSRLSVVMENTRRLVKAQPLLPAVGGGDEIAHLDKVFKDMVSALMAAREREREIEQMKQEFVSMVSHDLRTPLTSIQMFLSMLAGGMMGEVGPRVQERAAAADRNATRLIGLINDLLDMEKLESGQLLLDLADVEMQEVAQRALEAVKGVAESSGVQLVAPASGEYHVTADGDRLVQVLVNLLGNAIKFSQPSSSVVLKLLDQGKDIRLEVVDSGRGIPEHMQAAIFERFKQVEAADATKRKGSGLGLAICKAIIEQHGGAIGVTSAEGIGSTFWLTLPKRSNDSEPVAAATRSEHGRIAQPN